MPSWPGPRKYDPPSNYLAQQSADSVTLTLDAIEAMLGAPLPATARSSPFWSNYDRNPPAPAWRRVGWQTARQPPRQWVATVTFLRDAAVGAIIDPPLSRPARWWALGQCLRAGRQDAGLTQRALGQAVGTTQARCSEYERGLVRPALARLVQLAVVLGLDSAELLALARYQWSAPGGACGG